MREHAQHRTPASLHTRIPSMRSTRAPINACTVQSLCVICHCTAFGGKDDAQQGRWRASPPTQPKVDCRAIFPPAPPSPKATRTRNSFMQRDRHAPERGRALKTAATSRPDPSKSPFKAFSRLPVCEPPVALADFLCAFTFSSSVMYDSPSRKRSSSTANLRSLSCTSIRLAGSKCQNSKLVSASASSFSRRGGQ